MRNGYPCERAMLVDIPELDEDWTDSGEGGLAFFFVVLADSHRRACIVDGPSWGIQDVCFDPKLRPGDDYQGEDRYRWSVTLDCAMLIGSTGNSLWNETEGHYFQPGYADLTVEGQKLFRVLEGLYGKDAVRIVTLLDT